MDYFGELRYIQLIQLDVKFRKLSINLRYPLDDTPHTSAFKKCYIIVTRDVLFKLKTLRVMISCLS